MTITPYLLYEDVYAAMRFLARAVGVEEVCASPTDGTVNHAEMRPGGDVIYLGDPGADYRNPRKLGGPTVLVGVSDLDDIDARASAPARPAARSPRSRPTRPTASGASRPPTRRTTIDTSPSRSPTSRRRTGAPRRRADPAPARQPGSPCKLVERATHAIVSGQSACRLLCHSRFRAKRR